MIARFEKKKNPNSKMELRKRKFEFIDLTTDEDDRQPPAKIKKVESMTIDLKENVSPISADAPSSSTVCIYQLLLLKFIVCFFIHKNYSFCLRFNDQV